MRRTQYTAATFGVLASAWLSLEALAQERPPVTIEEVVVTAQKREERLQDVALSLSVVNESTIRDANISQVDDIVMLTPGLDFSQTLGRQNTQPLIRGIAPQFLTDPTVVVFVDGFSLGFTRLVNNELLSDLERIEVLKGPQATLYGRNALGGVVNYVTKKPSETPGGSVSAEYGSYDTYQVSASATGPIAPSHGLYGRVTAAARGSGGFLDNQFDGARDINDERDMGARGSLRWVLSDDLEINASGTYGKISDDCGDCSHLPSAYVRSDPLRFQKVASGLVNFNESALTTNMSFPGRYDARSLNSVVNVAYTQPGFTVTSITGYGYIDSLLFGDSNGPSVGSFIPGAPGYHVPNFIHGASEELRFASNGKSRLTWLAGLYAYKSTAKSELLFGNFALSKNTRTITNYAGFASTQYAVTDTVSVDVGVRYDYEKQESLNRLTTLPAREKSGNELLPRYSISYKPNDHMHLYVTASRGYHAGGFNDPRAPQLDYDPEYLWNYEVGLKSGFMGNRLQLQTDVFYLDWTKQQLNQSTNAQGSSVAYITNAGASRISGLESSVQWQPSDRVSLSAGVALMESKFKKFQDPVIAPLFLGPPPDPSGWDLSGNELSFAPHVSGSISAQYLVPVGGGGWNARLRADTRYMGKRFFDSTNFIHADSYVVANVYAGLQNERYEVGLYANNVFDESYLLGGTLPDLAFSPEVTLGDPRMYGIRFSARF